MKWSPLTLQSSYGHLVPTHMMIVTEVMGHWWDGIWQRGTEVLGEKPVPLPPCPAHIPCKLHWD